MLLLSLLRTAATNSQFCAAIQACPSLIHSPKGQAGTFWKCKSDYILPWIKQFSDFPSKYDFPWSVICRTLLFLYAPPSLLQSSLQSEHFRSSVQRSFCADLRAFFSFFTELTVLIPPKSMLNTVASSFQPSMAGSTLMHTPGWF